MVEGGGKGPGTRTPGGQMRQIVLNFAASAGVEQAEQRWLNPVLEAWPRHLARPAVERVSPARLLEEGEGPERGKTRVWLCVFGKSDSVLSIHQTIDAARGKLTPAVVVCDHAELFRGNSGSYAPLIEESDIEPATLAAELATLAQRQVTVEALARELSLAQSTQAGLRGEMDRIHEELQLAASVQRDFMPRHLPEDAGLEFGVLFRPAGYVSGDVYDVRVLDERRVAFFVADAVGHGVPAALLTMVISRALMRHGPEDAELLHKPAEALARLNTELCAHPSDRHRFATAVYGIIDTRTHELTLAGAGHPPPLVIGRDGVTAVETDGPLLGVFEGAPFSEARRVVEPGETLLIHTDGFELAFPAEGATGSGLRRPTRNYLTHFEAFMPGTGGADAPPGLALNDALLDLAARIDGQAGSLHQADDVTALALRINARAAEAVIKRAA